MKHEVQHPILSKLNPEQREAVTCTEGPLLILAGAGSGKTRVIVHRIGYLIEALEVSPFQILAVTFTNKAAQEMRERLGQLVSPEAGRKLTISTFHSACLKILRQHIGLLGLESDFVIYDAADQLVLVKSCVGALEINEDLFPPRMLLGQISRLKHQLILPEDYAGRAQDFGFEGALKKVYALYQERLMRLKGLDFDDLIGLVIRLFESQPELLRSYHERFRYIMIDEYQDTNHAQYRLIRLLTSARRNLCVVGDDDQSIYSFRGADVGNILSFERDFPETKVVMLNQNYRSTGTILSAASAMIVKNQNRKQKNLWTEKGDGEKIIWGKMRDESTEAAFVLKTIATLQENEGYRFSDFSILYRTNAQSRVIEEALRLASVPYFVYGGLRFYDRKEVKDLVAYLRLIVYPDDDLSVRRIVNLPQRGIGRVTLERLLSFAERSQTSLFDAIGRLDEIDLSPQGKRGLTAFFALMERLQTFAAEHTLPELIRFLIEEIRYNDYLNKTFGNEAESRTENILELVAAAEQFVQQNEGFPDFEEEEAEGSHSGLSGLKTFLDQIALVTSGDEHDKTARGVTLMTLHSAKGLEFPVVFLAGMEEGLFPHSRSLTKPREMEEERRLCYVGMTRAKERLYLLSATQRRLYGTTHWNNPSRFIKDLPENLVRKISDTSYSGQSLKSYPSPRSNGASSNFKRQRVSAEPSPKKHQPEGEGFEIGMMVQHPRFGVGRIERYEGSGEDSKVTVFFEMAGVKKMLLKYARLESWV